VVSRWPWVLAYAIGIAVVFVTRSPLLVLILVLGAMSLYRSLRAPRTGYYDVPMARRITMGAAYFGLLAVMALGMWMSEAPLAALHTRQLVTSQAVTLLLGLAGVFAERRVSGPRAGRSDARLTGFPPLPIDVWVRPRALD